MFLPPLSLAIWYPYVGRVGALFAAFSTMFVIYVLPLATFVKAVFISEISKSGKDSRISIDEESNQMQELSFRKLEFTTEKEEKLLQENCLSKSASPKLTSLGFKTVAVGSALLVGYGVGVFVIQLFYMSSNL